MIKLTRVNSEVNSVKQESVPMNGLLSFFATGGMSKKHWACCWTRRGLKVVVNDACTGGHCTERGRSALRIYPKVLRVVV